MKKLKEKRETIAVLIEEAESFLELGDLVIGQLIGHLCLERENIGENKNSKKCFKSKRMTISDGWLAASFSSDPTLRERLCCDLTLALKINRQRSKPTWAPVFFNLKLKCSHWGCSASDSLSSPRVTSFSRLPS